MTNPFLTLTNISKAFAGVQALADVSITIERGRIHCLVGENGCGKSTLIKIIAGVYARDGGDLVIDGRSYHQLQPIDAIRAGIQVIYQDLSLFPNLTVAENIALNEEVAAGKRLVNWRQVRRLAREALQKINVDLDLNLRVETMSVANKQLIAISKALRQNAQLIIMDEPTSALTEREIRTLIEVINNLQARGIAFLFVSHKLNEVLELSEKIIVMRNGRKVSEGERSDYNYARLAREMTGHDVTAKSYDYTPDPQSRPLLALDKLTAPSAFTDISFALRPGEILGLTGLLGCGRTELALALFGMYPTSRGTITVDGQPITIRTTTDAIQQGIGYIPEDRLTEGLFLEQSIGRNIVVRTLDQLLDRFGLLDRKEIDGQVAHWIDALRIKAGSPTLPVKTLSGGNQQRVVVAKWLASRPKVLILNGPTMGVDIGSKEELHAIIKELAGQGMGLIVISDDIPELLQTCNRILLMRRGRIAEEIRPQQSNESELAAKLTEA